MKIKKTVLIIMCILLLSPIGVAYADNGESKDSIPETIDEMLTKWIEDEKVVGATVAVVEDGSTIFLEGYGFADKAQKIVVNPFDTAFRIGSLSKTFVALSAMQLYESGQLDMHQDISAYLDIDLKLDYPVTMHDLLTHSAGFEEQGEGVFVARPEDVEPLYDVVEKYIPHQIYEPGEVYAYSNYGITLAGYVIEAIVGKEYYTQATEEIFNRLDMSSTTFRPDEVVAKEISKGYKNGSENIEDFGNFYPCGSMTSTASDMAKYMTFLLDSDDESLLGKQYKDEMLNKQFAMDESFDGLGYTWGRYTWGDTMVHMHMGGTDNFSSLIMICPEKNYGVFISCNSLSKYGSIIQPILDKLCGEDNLPKYDEDSIIKDSSIELDGSWVSTRRTTRSGEQFYNIASTIKINKTDDKGYEFFGKPINQIGDKLYFHPNLGILKHVERNDRTYLCNNEGSVFVKVPWYESTLWQLISVAAFGMSVFIGAILSIFFLVRSIKEKHTIGILLSAFTIFMFLLASIQFYGMYAAFMGVMHNSQIIAYINSMRIASILLGVFGPAHLVATIKLYSKSKFIFRKILHTLISLSWFVYMIWLFQVNLLF